MTGDYVAFPYRLHKLGKLEKFIFSNNIIPRGKGGS